MDTQEEGRMNKYEVMKALKEMSEDENGRSMQLRSGDAVIEFNPVTGMYILVTERFHVLFDRAFLGPEMSDVVLLAHAGQTFARMKCSEFEIARY